MFAELIGTVLFLFLMLNVFLPKKYSWPSTENLLSKLPHPKHIPYFGVMLTFVIPNEEFIPTLISIIDRFKPIFKMSFLGFHQVFMTDINDVETILNSRQHITKSEDYMILMPWLGTGLLTSTGEKWFTHRKLLTPSFHFGILEQYIDVFNKNAKTLTDVLHDKIRTQDSIEINKYITLCTLDIICETAMGTQVNAQLGGEQDYVKATLRMSYLFQKRQLSPWLYREFVFQFTPTGREQRQVLQTLHGFTERVIRERRETYKKEKDIKDVADDTGRRKRLSFLDSLIEISEKEFKMTEEEIREEVDTFMFEGHDTTAAAIGWALFELGHNPSIQEEVFKELNEIFGDSDRETTFKDLQEMKYLERVIKETLRLYPSVPLISRQLEVDITIKSYKIPAGTNIPIFIYYIHRDPKIYPEPNKFDPDRFLPEAIQGRHPYAYIPFSAGPRNCIGQRFALMEEKVVLSTLLRKFKFTSLDKRESVKMMAELILRPKNPLKMKIETRN